MGKRRKLNSDDAGPGTPAAAAAPTDGAKLPAGFLIELQRTLRLRLCGQTPLDHGAIRGYDAELKSLAGMFEASMSRGESNSALVIGTRGAGKTTLVNAAIELSSNAESAVKRGFKIVRLNGLAHAEDAVALKEMARQIQVSVPELVQTESGEVSDVDVTHCSTGDTVRALLAALKAGDRKTTQCLLVVLDEFDLFAHSGKQSLLYTLFDTAQAGSTPLSIVGITSRFDAEDLLEKRVLSRFSRRKVYLHHRLAFPDYVSAFEDCLTLAPFAPYDAECGAWNDAVTEFVKAATVQRELQALFDTNLDFRALHQLALHSISGISAATPFPSFKNLFNGSVQQKQDSKAAMILSLSMLELCLIIAANNVIVNGQMDGTCNFEVCYEEYRKFVLGTNNKVDWYNKPVAFKAFEHLVDLEIIRFTGSMAGSTPKRYRSIHLMVEPIQIEDALKRYPSLPPTLRNWLQSR